MNLKAYAYNHDSVLLSFSSCIRLSCLLLPPPPPMYEPEATWYLPLFNRGVARRSGHFRKKKSELTLPCMSNVARIGADPEL